MDASRIDLDRGSETRASRSGALRLDAENMGGSEFSGTQQWEHETIRYISNCPYATLFLRVLGACKTCETVYSI